MKIPYDVVCKEISDYLNDSADMNVKLKRKDGEPWSEANIFKDSEQGTLLCIADWWAQAHSYAMLNGGATPEDIENFNINPTESVELPEEVWETFPAKLIRVTRELTFFQRVDGSIITFPQYLYQLMTGRSYALETAHLKLPDGTMTANKVVSATPL